MFAPSTIVIIQDVWAHLSHASEMLSAQKEALIFGWRSQLMLLDAIAMR
jgi:hypothetical protein